MPQRYRYVDLIAQGTLPVDSRVEQATGRLFNKKVAIEPSKVAKNLKHRYRCPDMECNQSQSEDMAQQNRPVGPVIWNGVHLERCQEERGIGHTVGQIEDTLPALESILNGSSMLDKVLCIKLVDALLVQNSSQDVRVEDPPDQGLHHYHKGDETSSHIGDQKWNDRRIGDDERHKDIRGPKDVKVLEHDQIPSEVRAVHVL